jgi:hypothetical protein
MVHGYASTAFNLAALKVWERYHKVKLSWEFWTQTRVSTFGSDFKDPTMLSLHDFEKMVDSHDAVIEPVGLRIRRGCVLRRTDSSDPVHGQSVSEK